MTIKLKARITESLPGSDQFQFDGDRKFEHQVKQAGLVPKMFEQ